MDFQYRYGFPIKFNQINHCTCPDVCVIGLVDCLFFAIVKFPNANINYYFCSVDQCAQIKIDLQRPSSLMNIAQNDGVNKLKTMGALTWCRFEIKNENKNHTRHILLVFNWMWTLKFFIKNDFFFSLSLYLQLYRGYGNFGNAAYG